MEEDKIPSLSELLQGQEAGTWVILSPDMSQILGAAKTPEERSALTGEHMKAMQDGMSTMNGMMSHDKSVNLTPMPPSMMQKHMEMMQMMRQMMMDQMGPPAPAK